MKASVRMVSEMTVDELRDVIRDVIAEDIESWRETFEILSNKRLMQQTRKADQDWASRKKGAYVSWEDLKISILRSCRASLVICIVIGSAS
jgi:hypothetical protein